MLIKPKPVRAPVDRAPFYEGWDDMERFALWQIAYLWLNQEPEDPTPEVGTKEFVILQMLIRDAESSVLKVSLDGGHDWKLGTVRRTDLIAYANRKKKRPLFLFPDDRKYGWMA